MDLTRVLDPLIILAAWIWRGRAEIIETAGAACLAYGAHLVYVPAAWFVIGVWLLGRSYVAERKAKA